MMKDGRRIFVLRHPSFVPHHNAATANASQRRTSSWLSLVHASGKVVTRRDGFFKRYYPVQHEMDRILPKFMDMEDKIAIIVRDNPGAAQSEIAHLLDESRQKVHYHLNKMRKKGIIRADEHYNGHPRFFLAEEKAGQKKRREILGRTIPGRESEGKEDGDTDQGRGRGNVDIY